MSIKSESQLLHSHSTGGVKTRLTGGDESALCLYIYSSAHILHLRARRGANFDFGGEHTLLHDRNVLGGGNHLD